MTLKDLSELHARIYRVFCQVEMKMSPGYTEKHALPDGSFHTYKISGIKSPNQLEDELLSLAIWIWSMKDYLVEIGKTKGVDPQSIENIINNDESLSIIADIANGAKHGVLRKKTRTNKFPKITNVGITVPQNAIEKIVFGASNVDVDVSIPDSAKLHASIEYNDGTPPKDAFEILFKAINAWENQVFPLVGA